MRWCVLFPLLGFAACSAEPGDALGRAAEEYGELLAGGDPGPLLTSQGPGLVDSARWFAERTGTCESPELVAGEGDKRRYTFSCERGAVELELRGNERELKRSAAFARGIEEADATRAAAQRLAADNRNEGDDPRVDAALADLREAGPCEVREVELVHPIGAFHRWQCGDREAVVGLQLDREGNVALLKVLEDVSQRWGWG